MEAPRHGQLGARRGTALALLYALVAAAAPAAAEGTAAAVLVVAPEPRDRALAGQIEELLAAALDARGIRRARFGEEDVGVREETIRKQLDEALPRVTSGLRGQPFDEASAILNDAFFGAKQILGLVDPALLARLYKAFAAAQVTLGRTDLAEDYVAASLNMAPDQSPRSFQYFSAMERVVDAAHRRVTGPRTRVSIVAEPPDATIRVDGRDLGGSPVEIELTGGPHLLQVRAGGHHAQGWLKDAAAGDRWTITLRPVPGAARFDGLRDEGARGLRLERQALEAAAAGGATPPPPCPSEVLTALGRLADAEHVVLAVVESAGDRIAVRGCHQVRGVVSPIALVLARDASLLEGLRAALEAGLATGSEPPAAAVSAREPARDPRLRRAEGLLGTVEDRLRALAARERQLRALG
ncbi:MAG: PEGA domain-containing protein, partial [Deltaproteobacteria bacterium]|nr:PEGA domain-containing protein [Deltaproteobacteria bacterium]